MDTGIDMNKDKNKWINDLDSTAQKKKAAANENEHTRSFVLEGGSKEPLEKCEERGSLKEVPKGLMAWRFARPLFILLISVVIVVFIGTAVYNHIEQSYFTPVSMQPAPAKRIEVRPGSSLSRIATLLFEEGIIRNKFVFQMYVDLNDMAAKLQAGRYDLSPSMDMDEIIEILAAGDGGRKTVKITFTEGSTIEDMAAKLMSTEMFDSKKHAEFLRLCNDPKAFVDYDFITALAQSDRLDGRKFLLEGYLFPDTYEFYMDAEPIDVIKRLLNRFDNIFTLQYEDRAEELGMSIDEIMTLASIIEWEALPKDFKKVSSVLYNRINENMTLGSCATLRYITGVKKLVYTAEEMAIASPYNTYIVVGLPVGPVANPGQKAIEAALYPDEEFLSEKYLYFCNKDPETGELAYAKTLKEHEKNVAAYSHLW